MKRLGITEPRTDFKIIGGGPNAMNTMMATGKPPYNKAETFADTVLPTECTVGWTAPSNVSCFVCCAAPFSHGIGHVCQFLAALVAMGEYDPNLLPKGGAHQVFAWLQARRPSNCHSEFAIMNAVGASSSSLHRASHCIVSLEVVPPSSTA